MHQMKLWGVLAFALISATATTLAIDIGNRQWDRLRSFGKRSTGFILRLKLLSEIGGLIRWELVLHGRAHPIHHHIITVLSLDKYSEIGMCADLSIMYKGREYQVKKDTIYRFRDKAFRAKAMEFRPDQNQSNKEAAEAKFKEGLKSYEAIKKERKNNM